MAGAYLWGWDATNEVWVKCVVNADGKLIINPTGFLENPPTEDEDKKAPTSEWAFDHDADASAHHTKYTDANSRAAINNVIGADGNFDANFNVGYHSISMVKDIIHRFQGSDNCQISWSKVNNARRIVGLCNLFGTGYVDWDLEIYNGSGYQKIIREDTFQAALDDYLENPPVEDSVNTAPTSEWAFDHDADAAAHHAKYTDKEAADTFKARATTLTNGTYDSFNAVDESLIYLDSTDGDIDLRGMAGGYEGKIIFFVRTSVDNQVIVRHAHATPAAGDKFLVAGGDKTMGIGAYGCFYAIYQTNWNVCFGIP